MRKIKYILTIAALVACAQAQAQHKHEFSVYGAGGISTLRYSPSVGSLKNGFGGSFGAGYTFFFSEKIGLGTGLGMSLYNSKFTLDNLSDKYMATDKFGDAFEFRTTVTGYEEKQRSSFLTIPLMLQFQTGANHKFYAAAGGKIAMPLSGTYESSGATMRNSGYYSFENKEYTTEQFMGFGTFSDRGSKGDLEFKTAFMLSAEAGMKWRVSEKMSLYTGAYVDYSLNNINKESAPTNFVQYNSADPKNFTANSALTSQYSQKGFTDKVSLLSAGLKVQLTFGCTPAKRVKTPPEPVYVPPVVEPTVDNPQAEAEAARIKAAQEKAQAQSAAEERARIQREEEAAKAEQIKEELVVVKKEIAAPVALYSVNQTALSTTQKSDMDTKVELLKQYPDLKVVCEGHTCDLGGRNVNENIGLKRAEAAKAYLIEKGISVDRITTVSKRDSNPIVPNNSEENRRKNRRVELVIY